MWFKASSKVAVVTFIIDEFRYFYRDRINGLFRFNHFIQLMVLYNFIYIMSIKSFNKGVSFDTGKLQTSVMIETPFSKEIRIVLPKGQVMKDHKAPFPIIIHVLTGHIELGVGDTFHLMQSGDAISLDENVVHCLVGKEDTIVRLTLSKLDTAQRVSDVANA